MLHSLNVKHKDDLRKETIKYHHTKLYTNIRNKKFKTQYS